MTKCCNICGLHPVRVKVGREDNKCRSCYNAYMRDWNIRHRDKIGASNRNYKVEHRTEYLNSRYKTLFGITLAEYEQLSVKQEHKCAICGEPEVAVHRATNVTNKLSVDHDHATGVVRGLLCNRCNTAIGSFRDSIELLRKAMVYLCKER